MLAFFDVGVLFFEIGAENKLLAFVVVVAIGRFVGIGAAAMTEVEAVGIGEELGVDDGEIFFVNLGRIEAVFRVVIFFEGVIHGVDGGFAIVVAVHGVNIGFLDEEYNQEEGGKNTDNHKFDNREALLGGFGVFHELIIT